MSTRTRCKVCGRPLTGDTGYVGADGDCLEPPRHPTQPPPQGRETPPAGQVAAASLWKISAVRC